MKYLMLIVFIAYTFFSAKAQIISSRLIREFPSSIARKVCSQLNSVSSNEFLQLWLARQYMWQDSLLQAEFILEEKFNKEKLDRLTDSTNWLIEDKLFYQLNEKELTKYKKDNQNRLPIPVLKGKVIMDAELDSQFGNAIKLGDELHLKDFQYDSLFKSSLELRQRLLYSKTNVDSGYFDRAAFESDRLSKILTELQYNNLLVAIHREACTEKAKYAWFDMKTLGLNKRFAEEKAVKNILMYFLLREHITSRYASEKEKVAQMLGALKMPEELVALQEKRSAARARLAKYAW